MSDVRFRDTAPTAEGSAAPSDRPLRLTAETVEDLGIVSALVQDAVGRAGEAAWMPRRRRFALLLNRFRWEDRPAAEREGRPFERVRSLLVFDGVRAARARGVDPAERDRALSLLRIDVAPEPHEGGAGGIVTLALAGGGEVALEVECIDVRLVDLTRPWEARAARAPDHGLDEPA
jgi:hypothetical protein